MNDGPGMARGLWQLHSSTRMLAVVELMEIVPVIMEVAETGRVLNRVDPPVVPIEWYVMTVQHMVGLTNV